MALTQPTNELALPNRDRVTVRCVLLGLLLVISVNTWPIYGLYVIHINQMVFQLHGDGLDDTVRLAIPGVERLVAKILAARLRFHPLKWRWSSQWGLVGALFR